MTGATGVLPCRMLGGPEAVDASLDGCTPLPLQVLSGLPQLLCDAMPLPAAWSQVCCAAAGWGAVWSRSGSMLALAAPGTLAAGQFVFCSRVMSAGNIQLAGCSKFTNHSQRLVRVRRLSLLSLHLSAVVNSAVGVAVV
eukprot:356868-Chlamydomonas_euryale.AAC.18